MLLKQEIRVIPVKIAKEVKPGDKLYNLILQSMISQRIELADGDIVVIAQKIVSKAEGQIVPLNSLVPSDFALRLAEDYRKDPRVTELILRQSKNIVRSPVELLLLKLNTASYVPMQGSIRAI